MAGKVEVAIRGAVRTGEQLCTPTGRGVFEVAPNTDECFVLLLGEGQWRTPLPWRALEGIPEFLRGRDWVRIGSQYSTASMEGTLDAYLKYYLKRVTAGWVAVVLEKARVVEIDRTRPAKVRLLQGW